MRLEWDARKARENCRKHGVSFEEASSHGTLCVPWVFALFIWSKTPWGHSV